MTPTKHKILIVDDDADFLEAVSFFLQAHNYAVFKARDGRAGLQLAKTERPDLILIDIMMSERTEGFFTVQEIRRAPELKDVPVFVLSALYTRVPEFQVPPQSGWLGQDEFFSKPVDMAELLAAIRRRLGEAQRDRQEVQA
jgi:DNA-binding response OmpR family regulator